MNKITWLRRVYKLNTWKILRIYCLFFSLFVRNIYVIHKNKTDFPQETEFPVLMQNSYFTNFLQVFITLGTDM